MDPSRIHADIWDKAVSPKIKEANGLLSRDRPAFPEHVLHFTSAAALVSILVNKTLRVSRAKASNDPAELAYGIRLIRDELGRRYCRDDWDILFGDELHASFEGKLTDGKEVRFLDPHICCFTEAETAETVAHWAMYGRDGAGFALKFQAQALEDKKGVGLVKVSYDEVAQRGLIVESLKDAREAAQAALDYATKTQGGDYWPTKSFKVASHGFGGVLSLLAATMKAKAFEAETEWRLLHAGRAANEKGQEAKMAMGAEAKGSIIRTYFDIPFLPNDLVSITVGPVHADLNLPVVKRLLEQHDFTNTVVNVGTIALRTLG